MEIKTILLATATLLATAHTYAQQVKRKGVDLNEVAENRYRKNAQGPVYLLEQFLGKWQEKSRTDLLQKNVPIKDTIFLHFTAPNKVSTRDGLHTNMVGEAYIDRPGNVLIAAADVYSILAATKDVLVLDDQDKYIHTFGKTDSFSFEKYGNLTVQHDEYTSAVSITIKDIAANWSVYKRQAKPGAMATNAAIIRFLKITSVINDTAALGEIIFYKAEKSEMLPCKIAITDTTILITAGDITWRIFAYKANNKEFVFGDAAELLYFAKPI
jgi:hypothetical protein